MRKCLLIVLSVAAILVLASTSFALEKTAMRATDIERPDDWNAQVTCSVSYYNFCTGWIWVWGGWSPFDIVGVCYNTCCTSGGGQGLVTTWELIYTAAPPGYGFTGSIDVWTTDPLCGLIGWLAGQPFYFYSGWNGHAWGGLPVPNSFVVSVTCGPGPALPSRIASDHPAAGPTGPQACGYCYPLPRLCNSYYYGTATSPLYPGSSLTDGICCIEWVWDCQLTCGIAVTNDSWANIKSLYR
jgi:hypothetical protein